MSPPCQFHQLAQVRCQASGSHRALSGKEFPPFVLPLTSVSSLRVCQYLFAFPISWENCYSRLWVVPSGRFHSSKRGICRWAPTRADVQQWLCTRRCCLTAQRLQENQHLLTEIWFHLFWHSFWALNPFATSRSVIPFVSCSALASSQRSLQKLSCPSPLSILVFICFDAQTGGPARYCSYTANREAQPAIPDVSVVVFRDIESIEANQQPQRISLLLFSQLLAPDPNLKGWSGCRAH